MKKGFQLAVSCQYICFFIPVKNDSKCLTVIAWSILSTNAKQETSNSSTSRVRYGSLLLTHWGWVTHICICKLTIIGSDNGLLSDRRQAIIWTNDGILSIGPSGTKLSEILIAIHIFSFKKMHLKMSSGKWRPCYLGLNVLIQSSAQSNNHGHGSHFVTFLHFLWGNPERYGWMFNIVPQELIS